MDISLPMLFTRNVMKSFFSYFCINCKKVGLFNGLKLIALLPIAGYGVEVPVICSPYRFVHISELKITRRGLTTTPPRQNEN